MINHYESNLSAFIKEQEAKHWPFYKSKDTSDSEFSTWQDDFFFYQKPDGKRQSISILDRLDLKVQTIKSYKAFVLANEKHSLKSYYKDFAKAYTVYFFNKKIEKGEQFVPKEHCHLIQSWLGWLQKKSLKISGYTPVLHSQFMKTYDSESLKPSSIWVAENKVLRAIKLLQTLKVINPNITFKSIASCAIDRSTSEAKIRKKEKMPDADNIAAALSVFNVVMPEESSCIDRFKDVKSRYTASMFMLSLAATQRFAAENPYLDLYSLKCRTSSEGQQVYNFTFLGSKGFGVNQKHVLGPLIPFVKQALSYCSHTFEIGRSLARFYENPQRPATEVLGNIKVENWHGLNKKNSLTLWQLGGLLGLYKQCNKEIKNQLNKIPGFPYDVDLNQKLETRIIKTSLLGTPCANRGVQSKIVDPCSTPHELQQGWINYIKTALPNFPYRKHSNGNKVKLADALVVFNGSQIPTRNGYKMSSSPFAIEPLNVADTFRTNIAPSGDYFSDNGFSTDFALTPHQIRHYNNTVYQQSGVSDEHIAILSGRLSVQQNATYDHMTGEEVAFRLMFSAKNTKQDLSHIAVNVITATEYKELTRRAATDTGVGICTQDLHESPCSHLSDLFYHCVTCTKAAFCKGSKVAIAAMEKDIKTQLDWLEGVYEKQDLHKNKLSQTQFKQRIELVEFYTALINLMKSDDIADGNLIRFVGFKKNTVKFDIYDIKQRKKLSSISKKITSASSLLEIEINKRKPSEEKKPSMLSDFLEQNGIKL